MSNNIMASNFASTIINMGPLIIIMLSFWLLMIRPQQKKAKEHQKAVEGLQYGAEIIINNSIKGVYMGKLEDGMFSIEIAKNTLVMVLKESITHIIPTEKRIEQTNIEKKSAKKKKVEIEDQSAAL